MSSTPDTRIRLHHLSHVTYAHSDLDKACSFLEDFGFSLVDRRPADQSPFRRDTAWFRGYGDRPYVYVAVKGDHKAFLGGTFVVAGEEDLEKAAKHPDAVCPPEFADATSLVYPLSACPGGGRSVTLRDPNGFYVHLVHGQAPTPRTDSGVKVVQPTNYPSKKDRPVNTFRRYDKGKCLVHVLGHYGLFATDFTKVSSWYTSAFNLVPSDVLTALDDPDKEVGAFFHIDLGEELVDHHSFFVLQSNLDRVHHASFEVHDLDVQALAHDFLAEKGYKPCWGIGRHILGSQVFDYWFDQTGFILEHYSDGDLVNNTTKTTRVPATEDSLAIWGPRAPPSIITGAQRDGGGELSAQATQPAAA